MRCPYCENHYYDPPACPTCYAVFPRVNTAKGYVGDTRECDTCGKWDGYILSDDGLVRCKSCEEARTL